MESPIKNFKIFGLFGYKDVSLSFDNNVTIFIGENGIGKTTVLNALYFVLTNKFKELVKINFNTIEIQYQKEHFVISKQGLTDYVESVEETSRGYGITQYLRQRLNSEQLVALINIVKAKDDVAVKQMKVKNYLEKIGFNIEIPSYTLYNSIRQISFSQNKTIDIENLVKANSAINNNILYLPTYRRIETDLKQLYDRSIDTDRQERFEDYDEDRSFQKSILRLKDSFMQFGMADVSRSIENITKKISDNTLSGYNKFTSQMLIPIIAGEAKITKKITKKIEEHDVEIILSRVGTKITPENRKKIRQLLDPTKPKDNDNTFFLYYIVNLLDLYESQTVYDNAIKKFKDVCNKYLISKHFVYDEEHITLKLYNTSYNDDNTEISLSQLSSGEKQIVSLFAKIYLEIDKSFIIIYDEPEISLSIFWQKNLLPDILNSERCDLLLAATHSPYIFDNDLRQYTTGLKEFIKETTNE